MQLYVEFFWVRVIIVYITINGSIWVNFDSLTSSYSNVKLWAIKHFLFRGFNNDLSWCIYNVDLYKILVGSTLLDLNSFVIYINENYTPKYTGMVIEGLYKLWMNIPGFIHIFRDLVCFFV